MKKNNFRKFCYLPEISTKNLCKIGLLIAITIVLSAISGYLRIGNISKLSISFISVFVSSYAYGGIIGGFVGAAADIISFIVNPTGPFIPLLTIIEFMYGYIYGIFFFNTPKNKYIPFVFISGAIQFIINIFIKTLILSSTFNMDYNVLFISRIPSCLVQFTIYIFLLIIIKPYLKNLK